MTRQELFGLLATGLTIAGYVPYYAGLLRGTFRPHAFSWLIWGSTTTLVCFAQLAAGAGLGAWPIGLSGLATLGVALIAFLRRADTRASREDLGFLAAAFSALPAWFLTSDPLWAVVILTGVDCLGFGPTVRLVQREPWAESTAFYLLFALRNGAVLLALTTVDLATALFPVAVGAACLLLVGQILWRRRGMPRPSRDG